MHAGDDVRVVRCLDGLVMSFAILEHVQSDLYGSCLRIPSEKSFIPVAFWHCWSFVDTVHRIREVSLGTPGLSQRTPEFRLFEQATAGAEDFRHYIQHLREELTKSPGNRFPVWGSLSWVDADDPAVNHIVMAGARLGDTDYVGTWYDTVRGE